MAKPYLAFVLAATLASAFAVPAYAEGMMQHPSGSKLDVTLDPQLGQDGQANLKVSFLMTGTKNVQQHIDYNVVVKDSSGKEVFDAAKMTNQQVLHTAEGTVTIPFKFPQGGSYKVTVGIFGILFNPITPETADFSVNVTPEFPTGVLAAVGVVMAVAMVATRLKKF
jgi:hypothetical protein